jgi:DNA N-6-adenine-methyltransferase Dam
LRLALFQSWRSSAVSNVPWSRNDNYETPDYLRQSLEREFGLTLDPCPLNPEPDMDGLQINWDGEVIFCNPPWSDILPWVEKALSSRCVTVFVLPARTDTKWFHILKDKVGGGMWNLDFFASECISFVMVSTKIRPTAPSWR